MTAFIRSVSKVSRAAADTPETEGAQNVLFLVHGVHADGKPWELRYMAETAQAAADEVSRMSDKEFAVFINRGAQSAPAVSHDKRSSHDLARASSPVGARSVPAMVPGQAPTSIARGIPRPAVSAAVSNSVAMALANRIKQASQTSGVSSTRIDSDGVRVAARPREY